MTVHGLRRNSVPKAREFAEITRANGIVLTGYVFVEAISKIQDPLNEQPMFFPFIDKEERIYPIYRPFDQLMDNDRAIAPAFGLIRPKRRRRRNDDANPA